MTITSSFFKSLLASILIFNCTAFIGCTTTPQTATNANTDTMSGYADDTAITTQIKAAIFNDPTLHVLDISVETTKGQVQLSGIVNTQTDIDHALELTRNINGVRSVSTTLHIR